MHADTFQQNWTGSIVTTTPSPDSEMNAAAVEFERAMYVYKRRSGRPFSTWGEILEVLMGLGYSKPVELERGFPGHVAEIGRSGVEGERIALFLARLGGIPAGSRPWSKFFAFPSEAARAEAIDAARARYGWTSVEPLGRADSPY